VNRVLDRIGKLARGREVVIGGDFNISVSHAPGSWRATRKGELAIHARLADEFGLVNCWQAANPGRPPDQTLRWTGDRTTPYHCDGIFVPGAWRERLGSCVVLAGGEWDCLSDHNPIVAEFR
jgi:endonuclease/exonuclease/phosphatase family metal-dependent hydrolase